MRPAYSPKIEQKCLKNYNSISFMNINARSFKNFRNSNLTVCRKDKAS